MNTSVLRMSAANDRVAVWGPGCAFEPTMHLSHDLKQAVSYIVDPARLLSESKEDSLTRQAMALATPLIHQVSYFASPAMHDDDVIAAAASPLVRQEAARLALHFAEQGLELTSDPDEVAMPSVHQAPSGAIQFEWHRKGLDLEISVLPNGRIVGYVEVEGREPQEIDLSAGMWEIGPELNSVLCR